MGTNGRKEITEAVTIAFLSAIVVKLGEWGVEVLRKRYEKTAGKENTHANQ